MEYHVFGKVVQRNYVLEVDNFFLCDTVKLPITVEQYLKKNLAWEKYNESNAYIGGSHPNNKFLNDCILIHKDTIIEHKELFVIDVCRTFMDGDIYVYKNKEYKAKYKYNGDLNRHELYIDYILKLRENDLQKASSEIILNYIKEYNKSIKNKKETKKKKPWYKIF
jgi:hypothetical protein